MLDTPKLLEDLQDWYVSQCDGEWEHRYGIEVRSCDNPGWWVTVDLTGTALSDRPFVEVRDNVDEKAFALGEIWMSCRIVDGVWHGAGDPSKLGKILHRFLQWAKTAD